MVAVEFRVSRARDQWNWWHACNTPAWGVDWSALIAPGVAARLRGAKRGDADRFLRDYLDDLYRSRTADLAFFRGPARSAWRDRQEAILARLEKTHQRPFPVERIVVYYTSFPRAPYGYSKGTFWIASPVFDHSAERFLAAIVHELFHLFFEWYYWEACRERGLADGLIGHLKEAVTVLSNEEFQDIILFRDEGYAVHAALRRDLAALWRNTRDIAAFLPAACALLERHSPGIMRS